MKLVLVFEDDCDSLTTTFIRNRYNDSIMTGGNNNVLKLNEALKMVYRSTKVFP